ncbi:hypothetical protein HK104_010426 [Borealophlyctis nickersoniae]|nr:hypothetical protein HK104_010426 [Borealophlyctis nickersoniae]
MYLLSFFFILACSGMARYKAKGGYGIAIWILLFYAAVLVGLVAWSWNEPDSIKNVFGEAKHNFFEVSPSFKFSDIWTGRVLVALMAFQGILNIVYSCHSVITKELRADTSDLHSFDEACCCTCIQIWAAMWFVIAVAMGLLAIYCGTVFYH